jgi:hypothetical protein
MMSEAEIRQFVDEATSILGDRTTVTENITRRWLADQEEARQEGADAVYDDHQDGYHQLGGLS